MAASTAYDVFCSSNNRESLQIVLFSLSSTCKNDLTNYFRYKITTTFGIFNLHKRSQIVFLSMFQRIKWNSMFTWHSSYINVLDCFRACVFDGWLIANTKSSWSSGVYRSISQHHCLYFVACRGKFLHFEWFACIVSYVYTPQKVQSSIK